MKKQITGKKKLQHPAKEKELSPTPVSGGSLKWILACCVACAALILYANTRNHEFVLDDFSVIKENRLTRQGTSAIGKIFKTPYRYGYYLIDDELYRPVPKAIFAFCWQYWPNNPKPGHLLNILFYTLTGFVLFLVCCQWFKNNLYLSLGISLLFIAHPIHTEVVANIKSIDEILSFFFCITSAFFFYNYIKTKSTGQIFLSMLCYAIALFSKESSITFLVIFPLISWFFGEAKTIAASLKSFLPLLIPAVIFLLVRYNVLKNVPYGEVSVADNLLMAAKTYSSKTATAVLILGMYLKLLLWPHPLVFDYSYNQIPIITMANAGFIVSAIIYIALLVYAIKMFRAKNVLSFGILFFLISLSIYSNLFRIIGSSFGERFLYTPSLGVCICLAYVLYTFLVKKNGQAGFKSTAAFLSAIMLITVSFSIKTFARNVDWKSNYSLFSNDVKLSPNSTRTHYYLGNLLAKPEHTKGMDSAKAVAALDTGIAELKKSAEIYPKFCDAYVQLGVSYYRKKDLKNAFDYYNKAITCNPSNPSAHSNLGTIYFETGDYQNAERAFLKALSLDKNYAEAHLNLGSTYGMLKQYDKAIFYLQNAIRLDPSLAQAHYFLGITYRFKGDEQNAKFFLDKAHSLNPNAY